MPNFIISKYFADFIMCMFFTISIIASQNTWDGAVKNYEMLYNFYDNSGIPLTDIIPVNDQNNEIRVKIGLALDSLNGYDAVKGQIDISGSIFLEWTDEVFQQTENTRTETKSIGGEFITIDSNRAWSPSLVLLNAVDTVKNVGDTTYKLQFRITDGRVKWNPRVLLRASCRPDVTYYPFDRQKCSFTYTAWGFTTGEIDEVSSNEWDTSRYEPNGVWDIISTSSYTYQSSGATYAKFSIIIERQPLYFIFNIALPILLLGLLNGFVFLLPAESGERVGFCVTCFLAFVILLQTTMAYLPEIANPMSLLCFYVIVMMIFSMVINILTILMLRVYHKPPKDKVPNWLQKFVRVVSCMVCKRLKDKDAPPEETDWPAVGRLLDVFFFLAFLGAQSGFTIIFIIPVATGA